MTDRPALESVTATSAWIDALLTLFWAVQNATERDVPLPPDVRDAYDAAERARARL